MKANLTERSIGAALWAVGGSFARAVLQIGTQIVLARILGPEQYGILAVASLVIVFASYFSDMGIAYGLIQKKELEDRDVRFVFTWQLILGLFVALLVASMASSFSIFFNEPRVEIVLVALSSVCFINAICAPGINLLKRRLDYRSIQTAQFLGYFIGYAVVGIPLALNGAGVWSLVFAWIAYSICQLILVYIRIRHPVRPLLWLPKWRNHFGFGFAVLTTNMVNWFASNIDKVAVAKFFPVASVGLYTTSFNLLNAPTTLLYANIQAVMFSASAQRQNDKNSLRNGYLKLLGLMLGIFGPIFTTISALAGTLIAFLYGEAWLGAIPFMQVFALGMPMLLVWGVSTPVLWNTDQVWKESKIQLPVAILWAGVAFIAAQNSMMALAWSLLACLTIRVIIIVSLVVKTLDVTFLELTNATKGPFLSSILIASSVKFLEQYMVSLRMPVGFVLAASVLVSGALMALVYRYIRCSLSQVSRSLLVEACSKLPERIKRAVELIVRGPV